MSGSDQKHWDRVYGNKGEFQVSWFQDDPALSLELIRVAAPSFRVCDYRYRRRRRASRRCASGARLPRCDRARSLRSGDRDLPGATGRPSRAGNVDSRRRDALATGATLRPLARPRRFPFPYRSARPRGLCGAAHGGAAAKWTRHHRDLCARGAAACQWSATMRQSSQPPSVESSNSSKRAGRIIAPRRGARSSSSSACSSGRPNPETHVTYAASACSRSAMMSSASSMPIESRTTSGPAPA
jgi:hypothetical protein